jgi:hypothetical protein
VKRIGAALALALLAACGRGEAPAPAPVPQPATTRDSVASEIRTVGGLQARRTDVLGIVADLLSATCEEGTLTVGIRFRNAGSDSLSITIPAEEGVRLTAGDRDWPVAREEDGELAITKTFVAELAPGNSRLWRASFVAPPRAVHSFDLELPGVQPFTDVPITDVER